MSLKSSSTRYGSVAILLHWSAALGVVLAWLAGFTVADLLPQGTGAPLLVAHIVLGLLVFALTLLRIVWWVALDRRPAEVAGQPGWQAWLARAVHICLYVLLLMMASSGIVTLVLSGAVPTLLAGGPVPDFSQLIPRVAHGVMAKLLLVLLVLHVGAALYHQLVRRDHLLARMGIGS